MRFAWITAEGFWFDEFCIWRQVHMSFGEMLYDLVHHDVHPPLYQVLIWGWAQAVGSANELALRVPSAVVGALAVWMVYRLARQTLRSEVGALAATAWVAFNEFAIYYSQEARSYSLLFLLSVCTAYTWRRLDLGDRAIARATLWFNVAALLTAYTHVFGILFVGYFGLFDGISTLRGRSTWGRLLRRYVGVALGVALWLPGLYVQTQRVQSGFWIPKPSFTFWVDYLSSYAGHGLLALIALAVVVGGLRVSVGRFWGEMGWVVGWGGWMLGVPFVLSRVGQPMMHDKSAISVLAVMALLVGWGVREVWGRWGVGRGRRWVQAGGAVWALGSVASSVWGVYVVQSREAWREMSAAVAAERRASDVVALYHPQDDYFYCYRYYLDPAIEPVEARCAGEEACAAAVAEIERRWEARGGDGDLWLLKVRARGDRMDGLEARWEVAETRQMINGELQRLRRRDVGPR
jgi:hypothetical protein